MSDQKQQLKNGHHPTTRLFAYKQYWTHQGYYKVRPESNSGLSVEDVYNKCILHIMKWLKDRTGEDRNRGEELAFLDDYPAPEDYKKLVLYEDAATLYQRAERRYDISIFALKKENTWTLRIVEPNSIRRNPDNSRKNLHKERTFITNVAVKQAGDYVYIASRLTCKEPADNKEDAAVYRPAYLYYIYLDDVLMVSEGNIASDAYPICEQPLPLNTKSKTDCGRIYEELIDDENRQHPVVLVPSELDENSEKLLVSLARNTAGFAYFIRETENQQFAKLFIQMNVEDRRFIDEFKNQINKKNCLVINPKGNEKTFTWYATDSSEETQGVQKLDKLEMQLRTYTVRRDGEEKSPAYKYGNVLFNKKLWEKYVNDTEDAADYELIDRLKKELEQKTLEADNIFDSEDNKERLRRLEELGEKLKKLHDEKCKLEQQNIELAREIRKKDSEIFKKDDEIEKLKNRIEEIQGNREGREEKKSRKKAVDDFFERYYANEPKEKSELIDWVKTTFEETITVHQDAEKSFEKKYSENIPIEIVCGCILYLHAFVQFKRGDISGETFFDIVKSGRLERINSNNMADNENEKLIERKLSSGYTDKNIAPPAAMIYHKGADRLLNFHIKYGSNTLDTTRVYFLYDEEERRAVIGSMPDHLCGTKYGDSSSHNCRINKV